MLYYYILFISSLLFAFLARINKSKSNQYLLLILTLIFVFFAFREGFTPDYYAYESDFLSQSISSRHNNEPLYIWMVKHVPYRLMLILQTSLICLVINLLFRKSNANYWWFCVLLLFLEKSLILGNMGALRSSFVTIFFVLAIIIRDGSKKSFVLGIILIIVSSLIHKSGLIMLLPYLLCTPFAFKKNTYYFFLVISIVLIFLSLFYANTINTWANILFEDNEGFGSYKRKEISNTIKMGTFTILRLVLLFYLFFTTLKHINIEYDILSNKCIKVTALYLLLLLMPGIGLSARISYYLSLPVLIGSTTIIDSEKGGNKMLYIFAWILLAAWDMYLFANTDNYTIIYSFYHNILFN